jgi:uncharacterized integral membrane protein
MASTPAEDASRLHRSHDEPEPAPTDDPAGSTTTEPAGPAHAAADGEPSSTTATEQLGHGGAAPDRAPATAEPRHRLEPSAPVIRPTRTGGIWVSVIVAAVVLIFLLIFILQNLTTVTVNLLGFSGSLPLGVAMLFAAIAGAILVAMVGTARILQLRRFARRVGTTRRSPRQRS